MPWVACPNYSGWYVVITDGPLSGPFRYDGIVMSKVMTFWNSPSCGTVWVILYDSHCNKLLWHNWKLQTSSWWLVGFRTSKILQNYQGSQKKLTEVTQSSTAVNTTNYTSAVLLIFSRFSSDLMSALILIVCPFNGPGNILFTVGALFIIYCLSLPEQPSHFSQLIFDISYVWYSPALMVVRVQIYLMSEPLVEIGGQNMTIKSG